ncbi:MAG: L,D-transpeptidase family protein [Planctomycetales bacterium]
MLAVFKAERELHLFAAGPDREAKFVKAYPVHGASGESGPKLREGDRQVPEGCYRIDALHPNSRFHLSLRIDYPNEFDRARGAEDGRAELGENIFIHGGSASVGCVAVGDEAIEELFVLAVDGGIEKGRVILSPRDLRRQGDSPPPTSPPWTVRLYAEIERELAALPLPR